MRDVLGLDQYLHLVTDGNVHYRRDHVILATGILGIEPHRVSRRGAHKFRLRCAKLAVRSRIAEVPSELLAGDLHLERPRRRSLKMRLRPGMLAVESQPDE